MRVISPLGPVQRVERLLATLPISTGHGSDSYAGFSVLTAGFHSQ